jgi:hypothetical protein
VGRAKLAWQALVVLAAVLVTLWLIYRPGGVAGY